MRIGIFAFPSKKLHLVISIMLILVAITGIDIDQTAIIGISCPSTLHIYTQLYE